MNAQPGAIGARQLDLGRDWGLGTGRDRRDFDKAHGYGGRR